MENETEYLVEVRGVVRVQASSAAAADKIVRGRIATSKLAKLLRIKAVHEVPPSLTFTEAVAAWQGWSHRNQTEDPPVEALSQRSQSGWTLRNQQGDICHVTDERTISDPSSLYDTVNESDVNIG